MHMHMLSSEQVVYPVVLVSLVYSAGIHASCLIIRLYSKAFRDVRKCIRAKSQFSAIKMGHILEHGFLWFSVGIKLVIQG